MTQNNHHPVFAIIGGSGLTRLANLEMTRRKVVRTPYGEPSGALTFGRVQGCEVVFLARHGYGHTIPPHEVNYRANIWALHAQQIKFVVSVASVGGIRTDLVPGTLVVPDQIIDYTWGRDATFFGTSEQGVTHIDFTHPYCDRVRG
ncbi:MAG: S-methyl-5'-thioinosine phosphorylase, partial [Burkholderiales bacterium]